MSMPFEEEAQRFLAAAQEARTLEHERVFTDLAELLSIFYFALRKKDIPERVSGQLTSDYFNAVMDGWTGHPSEDE